MTTEITSDFLNHPQTTRAVIYQRATTQIQAVPEFKPGNTPYTQLGNETLNANIYWPQIIQDILAHYTQQQLITETGLTSANMLKINQQNYRKLNFKMGAKLLAIHCRFYPEQY